MINIILDKKKYQMKEKYIIGNNNYEVIILKTIWKGAINFGLVNIPVKLKTATSRQNIRFRNLHEKCNNPVKFIINLVPNKCSRYRQKSEGMDDSA